MAFKDIQAFMKVLEDKGQLKRITTEVDSDLEITEITDRVSKKVGPALLFENVKGSKYPVLINALIIPLVLMYGYKLTDGYILLAISIFIGQFIAIYIIGGLMYFPLKKVLARFKVINSKEDIN